MGLGVLTEEIGCGSSPGLSNAHLRRTFSISDLEVHDSMRLVMDCSGVGSLSQAAPCFKVVERISALWTWRFSTTSWGKLDFTSLDHDRAALAS